MLLTQYINLTFIRIDSSLADKHLGAILLELVKWDLPPWLENVNTNVCYCCLDQMKEWKA